MKELGSFRDETRSTGADGAPGTEVQCEIWLGEPDTEEAFCIRQSTCCQPWQACVAQVTGPWCQAMALPAPRLLMAWPSSPPSPLATCLPAGIRQEAEDFCSPRGEHLSLGAAHPA